MSAELRLYIGAEDFPLRLTETNWPFADRDPRDPGVDSPVTDTLPAASLSQSAPGLCPATGALAAALCHPVAAETENSGIAAEPQISESQKIEKNRYRLLPDQYLPQVMRKDLIVLHFTAGRSSESAYKTWKANPERVATAYGVDPDGSICEFFPPECWAYHLGIKGTHAHDRRSIGIEIANVGPLKLAPNNREQLNWWPADWGTLYCRLDEREHYRVASYRGIEYFAAMPEAQQESVGALVRDLCQRFQIPREASLQARNGDYDPNGFAQYRGVATHANFRRDKWDVGPAFNWAHLGF